MSGVPFRGASDSVPIVQYEAVKLDDSNIFLLTKHERTSGRFVRYCIAPQLRCGADDPGDALLSRSSSLRANAREGHTVGHKEHICRRSSNLQK